MAKAKRSEIETYARPYLKIVIETCAREHMEPEHYFLLVAKYDASRGMLVPRSVAADTIAIAKTAVQREKMEKLLAMPCEPKQLLVIVTAGEYVEGQLLRVPTIAPDPDKVVLTRAEMDAIERYQRKYGPSFSARVDAEGGKLSEYVAILRFPDQQPILVKREMAREALKIAGYGDVVAELDVPAKNDDELLCLYKVKGKSSWSRLQYPSDR